jgi:hypothetical protein
VLILIVGNIFSGGVIVQVFVEPEESVQVQVVGVVIGNI